MLLVALNPAQDLLGDSVTAIGFAIAFYYGFTGLRLRLVLPPGAPPQPLDPASRRASLPLLGGVLMGAVFVKAFLDYRLAGAGYAAPFLGIQVPIVIGIGSLLLGIPLMILAAAPLRRVLPARAEIAPPGIPL